MGRFLLLWLCACVVGINGAEPARSSVSPLFSDAEWQAATPSPTTPSATAATTTELPLARAAGGLLVSLAVLVVVALAVGWVLRRAGMRRVLPGRGQHLRVIETVPLGFKRSVSVVQLGDQVILIGQGEHELCHVATFPAQVLRASLATDTSPVVPTEGTPAPELVTTPPSAFRNLLDGLQRRRE